MENGELMSEANATPYQLHAASGDLLEGLCRSDALDRIQALLSEWLRIENMVILVGAGCSISQNGVSLARLEDHVVDTLLDLGTDIADLGTALDLVQARKDQGNGAVGFETWLSSLATAKHALEASGSLFQSVGARLGSEEARLKPSELSSLMAAISRIIVSRCSLTLPPLATDGPFGHHALIAKLVARDPTLGRTHLFTVNYDLLLEAAADDLRVRYSTGFIGTVEPKFDSSAYSLDLYYPGDVAEGRVQRFDNSSISISCMAQSIGGGSPRVNLFGPILGLCLGGRTGKDGLARRSSAFSATTRTTLSPFCRPRASTCSR